MESNITNSNIESNIQDAKFNRSKGCLMGAFIGDALGAVLGKY
jgi:hypothetical protein